MPGIDFERMAELKERKHEKARAERKREDLLQRIGEQERLIVKLEVELEMEQEDVDKLTRMSLVNLFHTILRSKDEQLELERQQALTAALKLQEAKQTLEELKQELTQVGELLSELSNANSEYNQMLLLKESALRNAPHAAEALAEMEEQISDKALLLKEINEALSAGKGVINSLTYASESLKKAESWGNWDMWANGGVISTYLKHGHIDDAKASIHVADYQLRTLNKELADLQKSTNIYIDISDMLKMADFWFDGLIADWIVQGRIQDAQEQTLDALQKVRGVVESLAADYRAVEQELSVLKNKRIAWIEETRHQ